MGASNKSHSRALEARYYASKHYKRYKRTVREGLGAHGARLVAALYIWFDVSVLECPMRERVVVVGVAGRGGLRWRRDTRVVVVRCALLAETAVGRSKS